MQGYIEVSPSKYKIAYPAQPPQASSLYWVQLAGMVMSIITTIWTVLLLLANWGSLSQLIKIPTVTSVITFSNCMVFLAFVIYLLAMSVINVALTNGRDILKSARDDLLIVFSAMTLMMVCEMVFVLIWSFKALSLAVNISIILTFVYPIVSTVIFVYSLYYLTMEPEATLPKIQN